MPARRRVLREPPMVPCIVRVARRPLWHAIKALQSVQSCMASETSEGAHVLKNSWSNISLDEDSVTRSRRPLTCVDAMDPFAANFHMKRLEKKGTEGRDETGGKSTKEVYHEREQRWLDTKIGTSVHGGCQCRGPP